MSVPFCSRRGRGGAVSHSLSDECPAGRLEPRELRCNTPQENFALYFALQRPWFLSCFPPRNKRKRFTTTATATGEGLGTKIARDSSCEPQSDSFSSHRSNWVVALPIARIFRGSQPSPPPPCRSSDVPRLPSHKHAPQLPRGPKAGANSLDSGLSLPPLLTHPGDG